MDPQQTPQEYPQQEIPLPSDFLDFDLSMFDLGSDLAFNPDALHEFLPTMEDWPTPNVEQ
jgi:hypothetical protein